MNSKNPDIIQELVAALELLKTHFLSLQDGGINEVDMARKGLAAMMAALGDPFTNYVPPSQLEHYKSRKKETVVGIGLLTEFDQNKAVRIISSLTDSPSDIPALKTGDELLLINGVEIRNTNVGLLNKQLNGTEGTQVNLTVVNPAGIQSDVTVERRGVNVDFLSSKMIDTDKVFVRLAWFSGTVFQSFIDQVKQFQQAGAKGLILDVRSNSGGSIMSTRSIFSSVCDQEVMYYGKVNNQDNIKDNIFGTFKFELPIVVLVNHATFSAGEVLAGALQDYGRAVVIGTTTGGKGSMQQVFPLNGEIGGAMRITTATNCTPSGRILQGNGVVPDFVVEQAYPELFVEDGAQNITEEGRRYLTNLRLESLIAQHGEEAVRPVWEQGDSQFAKAVEVIDKLILEDPSPRKPE